MIDLLNQKTNISVAFKIRKNNNKSNFKTTKLKKQLSQNKKISTINQQILYHQTFKRIPPILPPLIYHKQLPTNSRVSYFSVNTSFQSQSNHKKYQFNHSHTKTNNSPKKYSFKQNSFYQQFSAHDFLFQKNSKKKQNMKVFWIKMNKQVILKKIKVPNIKINHQNILKVQGTVQIQNQKLVIIGNQIQNPLRYYLNDFGRLKQKLCKKIIKQIAMGVKHLHDKQIIHGKLSLDSIFHNNQSQVYINILHIQQNYQNSKNKFIISLEQIKQENKLPYFTSPESLTQLYKKSTDIWSIGCITIQLLFGNIDSANLLHPYNRIKNLPLTTVVMQYPIIKILHGRLNYTTQICSSCSSVEQYIQSKQPVVISKQAEDFIKQCLLIDEEKRPKIWQLLKHNFLLS